MVCQQHNTPKGNLVLLPTPYLAPAMHLLCQQLLEAPITVLILVNTLLLLRAAAQRAHTPAGLPKAHTPAGSCCPKHTRPCCWSAPQGHTHTTECLVKAPHACLPG